MSTEKQWNNPKTHLKRFYLYPEFFTERKKSIYKEGYTEFVDRVKKNPACTKTLLKDHVYDPELVLWFRKDPVDMTTAHSFLIHTDETASWVSYDTETLDHAIRWIAINPDMQAIGLLLPATAYTEGFTQELQKDNVKYLSPKETVVFRYSFGVLQKEEWRKIASELNMM